MGMLVRLESPPGTEISRRSFEPYESVRVKVHMTTALGFGSFNETVTLSIEGPGFPPIFAQASTNILGDAWFDVLIPNANTRSSIVIVAKSSIFGQMDQQTIPISIGSLVTPPYIPPYVPPADSGGDGSAFDPTSWPIEKVIKTVIYIALGVGLLYVLTKSAPGIIRSGKDIRREVAAGW